MQLVLSILLSTSLPIAFGFPLAKPDHDKGILGPETLQMGVSLDMAGQAKEGLMSGHCCFPMLCVVKKVRSLYYRQQQNTSCATNTRLNSD